MGLPGTPHHNDLQKLLSNSIKYCTAVQLITGHTSLNYHLYKMTLVESATCPFCEDSEETVAHFLGQCPAHSLLRNTILNTFYSSLQDIFSQNTLQKIITFAELTGRLQSETDQVTHTSGVT